MRTIQDALDRAKSLRDFKAASPDRFEKCNDFQDLATLADEVERLTHAINDAAGNTLLNNSFTYLQHKS